VKDKRFDAVELKRCLQKDAEKRLVHLSETEQLKLLRDKYGHLMKRKDKLHVA